MSERRGRALARARRSLGLLVVDVTPLRESQGFRWLFTGQLGSVVSRQFLVVAVPYEVFVLTGSNWLVGLVGLVQVAPLVVGSLLGGTAADALDRRSVLIVVQALTALTSIGLAANSGENARVWLIMILVAANAGLNGAEAPTRTAIIPALVRRERLASAFALNQTMNQTAQIAGPAIAGLLIARFDIAAAYWVSVVAAAYSGFAMLPLGTQRADGAGGRVRLRATVEAWRYLRRVPLLQQIMLIDLNAMVFGMPRALFPVIGLEVFDGDAATVGMLYAALGVGALIGAITTGWAHLVRRQGRVIVYAVSAWGLSIIAFGLAPNLSVALVCLGMAGAADVVSNVFRTTLLQLTVPDSLRGRLTSFKSALAGGGPPLGDAEAGAVAAITTPIFSVISGGVLSIVGTIVIVWRGRDIWHQCIDDAPDVDASGAPPQSGTPG